MLAAPLIAGNDLRDMKPEIHDILTNKEVIAVDQDSLGRQGRRVWKNGDLEVWSKALAGGSRAVILFNRGEAEKEDHRELDGSRLSGKCIGDVRDLWQKKDLGKFTGKFSAPVAVAWGSDGDGQAVELTDARLVERNWHGH